MAKIFFLFRKEIQPLPKVTRLHSSHFQEFMLLNQSIIRTLKQPRAYMWLVDRRVNPINFGISISV